MLDPQKVNSIAFRAGYTGIILKSNFPHMFATAGNFDAYQPAVAQLIYSVIRYYVHYYHLRVFYLGAKGLSPQSYWKIGKMQDDFSYFTSPKSFYSFYYKLSFPKGHPLLFTFTHKGNKFRGKMLPVENIKIILLLLHIRVDNGVYLLFFHCRHYFLL
jgi:hypothetical protein